jgi:hypothetical protein
MEVFHSWTKQASDRGISLATLIRLRMDGRDVVATARKAG